jgi:hypothetical protein
MSTVRHFIKHGVKSFESAGIPSLEGAGDFESQYNPGGHQDTIDEIYLPTLEELLHPREKNLTKEPKSLEHALQMTNHRSLQRGSSSPNTAQSILVGIDGNQGRCIDSAPPQTRQLLTMYKDTGCS